MSKIEELRAAYGAATPGTWNVKSLYVFSTHTVTDGEDEWEPVICVADDDEPTNYEANARLIAIMHRNMPVLLEAVEVMLALGDAYDIGQPATKTSAIGKYRAIKEKLQ